jgi:hypothetical protein
MANDHHALRTFAAGMTAGRSMDEMEALLAPRPGGPREQLGGGLATPEAVARRWQLLGREPGPWRKQQGRRPSPPTASSTSAR